MVVNNRRTEGGMPVTKPETPISFRPSKAFDNPPPHRPAAIRDAIKAAGARLLYLPPYSPDFNPIENAFAKLKAFLRKVAARTINDLWDDIRKVLPLFTPDDCANYFTAAGYEPE